MQWSKQGAHLLIQVRAKVVNGEFRQTFQEWYKDFRVGTEDITENMSINTNTEVQMLAMAA